MERNGFFAYTNAGGPYREEDFFRLPEDIQETVNRMAIEGRIHSEKDLRSCVNNLLLRA